MTRRAGQINKHNRWNKKAWDVDLAYWLASLGKNEGAVMYHAIKHSWTLPRLRRKSEHAVPVKLSSTAIAERYALDRPGTCKAITSLVRRRFLVETPDGHAINKQFDEWLSANLQGPALTPDQVAACFREIDEGCVELDTKPVSKSTQGTLSAVSTLTQDCVGSDTTLCRTRHNSVSTLTQDSNPPLEPPTGERAQEDLIQTEEDSKDNTTPRVAAVSDGDEERHRRQSILQARSGLWDRGLHDLEQPGPHDPDPARWDAWLLIADRLDLGPEVRAGFLSNRRQWPTEWLVLALKLVHHAGKRPRRFQYYRTILESWARDGRPESGEWDYLDDNLRPLLPSQRTAKPQSRPTQSDAPAHPSHIRATVSRIYPRTAQSKEIA